MDEWTPVGFAAFGSAAIGILELLERPNIPPPKRPNLRDPFYLAKFILMPILAGGLAFAYVKSGQQISPLLAMQIGASTPLILRAMAAVAPRLPTK